MLMIVRSMVFVDGVINFMVCIFGSIFVVRESDAFVFVVSMIEYVILYVFWLLVNLNCFILLFMSVYGVIRFSDWFFVWNCWVVSLFIFWIFKYCISIVTTRLFYVVVVGDFKFSVLFKIVLSNILVMCLGKNFFCIVWLCVMMDDMYFYGWMSTKIGRLVTMVFDCSAWWSIIFMMFFIGIVGFNCDCCWKLIK